jgi:threonylcarbamoyladenosine tRNA methylthiotransferase MtaB
LARWCAPFSRHVSGLRRLRLSSIDSIEADDDLLRALAEEERLMPHLHLSLQSGDDLILKRMKRRHSAAEAEAFCARVRTLRPDVVFGADFITGFPTETEEMFASTLRHVEACGLTHLHVFPFSPRSGTPAARMPQVEPSVARERAARLRSLGQSRLEAHLDRQIGRSFEALVENGGIARTPDFTPLRVPVDIPARSFCRAEVTGHDGTRLLARVWPLARD